MSDPASVLMEAVYAMDSHVNREQEAPELQLEAWDLRTIREARRLLADMERAVENRCGSLMKSKRETIEGLGTLERRQSKKERCDDEAGLLRLVIDSRHVDPDTGETESPVDAVVSVYGSRSKETGELRMPARLASKTALRDRGIPTDDFFETVEDNGWSVRTVTA